MFKMQFSSDFENLHLYWETGLKSTEYALNQTKVKSLIARKDLHFDLVVLEQFFHETLLMFAHKFKCPVVTLGTLGYADNMDRAMGLLTPWSFVPHLFLSDIYHMNFYQRAFNTYISLYDALFRHWYYLPQMQAMAEQHFGGFIEGKKLIILMQEIFSFIIDLAGQYFAPSFFRNYNPYPSAILRIVSFNGT